MFLSRFHERHQLGPAIWEHLDVSEPLVLYRADFWKKHALFSDRIPTASGELLLEFENILEGFVERYSVAATEFPVGTQ